MKVWRSRIVAALLLTLGVQAHAGVIIGGTRLVYDGSKKESSLGVSNPDKIPYLIQSWVTVTEGGTTKAPFIITPPLFRLGSGQNNILRVVRASDDFPSDRESLFWLNVKSIPSSEKATNTLQIAIKTSMKLIYRPKGLPGSLDEAAQGLTWQKMDNSIQVTNTSPYYLTFFKVEINGREITKADMVAPRSTARFELPTGISGGTLNWQIINDYGGTSKLFSGNL